LKGEVASNFLLVFFGGVVEDEGFIEEGFEFGDECGVFGVGEVGFEAFFVLEGDDEAVGEAVVEWFDVFGGAPFVAGDGVDFGGESGEGLFDFLDLGLGGLGFEFEHDDVAEFAFGAGGGKGDGHDGECGDDECFHGFFRDMILLEAGEDCIGHACGGDFGFTVAAGGDVAGADAIGDGFGDGVFDGGGGFGFSEGEAEEHGEGEDLCDGVGDALAGDVGSGAAGGFVEAEVESVLALDAEGGGGEHAE